MKTSDHRQPGLLYALLGELASSDDRLSKSEQPTMVSLDKDGESVRIAQPKRRQQLIPVRHGPSVTGTPGVEAAPQSPASRSFS